MKTFIERLREMLWSQTALTAAACVSAFMAAIKSEIDRRKTTPHVADGGGWWPGITQNLVNGHFLILLSALFSLGSLVENELKRRQNRSTGSTIEGRVAPDRKGGAS